jgi:hypothetical protein
MHTDELLRAHKVLLSTDARGARLVDWETEKPVDESRAIAYLDELESELPMGFPGEDIATMLRRSLVTIDHDSDHRFGDGFSK